jgi:predicted metal-dependent hydrolase
MNEDRRVRYGDTVIPYRVLRLEKSPPRVRVQVEPDGRVVVQAPADASDATISAVVKRRSRWIHEHMRLIADRKALQSKRDWVSGESHRYLGRRYMLKVRVDPADRERVVLAGGQLRVAVAAHDPQRVRRLVHDWYRERADAWLRNRVSELAAQLPWVRKAPSVAIRQMKSRWGSCSPAGRLTLNPVLVRAPREAVDYVIVHELCHLRHHNHSRSFYLLLTRHAPGWEHVKKRLDAMAEALYAELG